MGVTGRGCVISKSAFGWDWQHTEACNKQDIDISGSSGSHSTGDGERQRSCAGAIPLAERGCAPPGTLQ